MSSACAVRTFRKHSSSPCMKVAFDNSTDMREHTHKLSHTYMQANAKLFWRANEGKTHVPFIMMFSLNFSIHRVMFFVLSGFLFLDTNCASMCTTYEMYWCRFYMSSAWLCCRCCCCLFSTAWLDASPVSSFSSKKIKSTEQMPLFRANPIVPLCNVYRKLHFEDHKHTRYGGCVRWFFFCCSLFYKFFDSCIVSCAPFITYNMGCSSGKSKN